jgi:two-component system LytT family sensor kinase
MKGRIIRDASAPAAGAPVKALKQPVCHRRTHHNTFIFSSLTGLKSGRYSQAVGQEGGHLSGQQLLFVTLIVRIAVVSVLATMLVRYHRFRDLLIDERRGWPMKLFFAFGLGLPLTAGVVARLLLRYNGLDLTLEGAFLAGLVTGPWAGALVGAMIGTPALIAGEWAALPFAIGCGFAAGGIREACPKEAIWKFSPFVFGDVHRFVWRIFRRFDVDWQVVLLAAPMGLELLKQVLGHRWPTRLYFLDPISPLQTVMVFLGTILCIAAPIKIWNSARIEHRLHEQEKLLMKARIDALANQINPHFLFNTLASISSLVRTKPETARMLILKLSNMLRRRLRTQDHFVSLREEIASVDEYLDIEAVRFGRQLQIEKQFSPDTLDALVPSMILQPLVENSIKHGIAPKVGGGRIVLRSVREDGRTVIEVDDNGLGMSEERLQEALRSFTDPGSGIGLSNVDERLRVIYGAQCSVRLTSVPGRGTVARLEIPDVSHGGGTRS